MSTTPDAPSGQQRALLAAARRGDEDAFGRLLAPHRAELHAHCYRMLGSVHDAEDALQDALLRAWRGLPRFEGRSSLRAWLYRIATNACLNAIERRPARVLPMAYGASSDPQFRHEPPLDEPIWIEPYPDARLGLADGLAAPAARYEQRESVELAFVAALQVLPPGQRATLIMREVLGFSAREVAESLGTTVASVNSALQRARRALGERLPAQSQQATLRALGDKRVSEIVERYMDAMGRGDVKAVVGMLAEDAAWSMPPLGSWFRGHDALTVFLQKGPLSGEWRWRHLPATASGQPAVGCYTWHADEAAYLPFALDVLTLRAGRIQEVTAFIARSTEGGDSGVFARWPDQAPDPSKVATIFERFGLPARLG